MSGRPVGPGARATALLLACGALLACGERVGEPIIATVTAPETPDDSASGAGGGADMTPMTSLGGEGPLETPGELVGPVGLCGACTSSDACGDANDACIRHQDQSFCGRDCDEQRGCPDGYTCVELSNTQLWQCVPQTTCPQPSPQPTLADLRDYLLARINAERLSRNIAPLKASSCLDDLAQASAVDFARTDEPLGKYVKECDPVWPNCACGWNAEAEISIARYGLDWQAAVERAVGQSRDAPADRFSQAFLASDFGNVGIGFWLSADEAWIALSFR
ncbi:MAG TPA: hypothetical protein VHB79_12365 [Polyangiaceae bacterium]|nr:hypothetical protein [Polyangiaceae bacterium]